MKPVFSNWLKQSKGFAIPSAHDVVSRLKRASSMCNIKWDEELESNLFFLSQQSEFKKLSPSVKSQLKRAVKLYYEFSDSIRVAKCKSRK